MIMRIRMNDQINRYSPKVIIKKEIRNSSSQLNLIYNVTIRTFTAAVNQTSMYNMTIRNFK